MVSKSTFTSSNIEIQSFSNSIRVSKKLARKTYHKTIAISHGSGGVTQSEIKIADFLLENDFEVEIIDHFSPLCIKKMNWDSSSETRDNHDFSLLNLINTIDGTSCQNRFHLGMSLGGYIGINNSHLYEKVFCCYPGILPLIDYRFMENRHKLFIFEGVEDTWTKFPEELKTDLRSEQFFHIENAHHSFMSFDKDLTCNVYGYQFKNLLMSEQELSQIQFNHQSLSQFSVPIKIVSRNKSDENSFRFVLDRIINEVKS